MPTLLPLAFALGVPTPRPLPVPAAPVRVVRAWPPPGADPSRIWIEGVSSGPLGRAPDRLFERIFRQRLAAELGRDAADPTFRGIVDLARALVAERGPDVALASRRVLNECFPDWPPVAARRLLPASVCGDVRATGRKGLLFWFEVGSSPAPRSPAPPRLGTSLPVASAGPLRAALPRLLRPAQCVGDLVGGAVADGALLARGLGARRPLRTGISYVESILISYRPRARRPRGRAVEPVRRRGRAGPRPSLPLPRGVCVRVDLRQRVQDTHAGLLQRGDGRADAHGALEAEYGFMHPN